ncbi:DUF3592 domain-containing protein [Hymenobacter sp. P5252]|uniref:DUF3592 domain-containing protein n=1 Tax=Hymenobacter terrestris TaxID=2748310 RepID=A0ABX2Q4H1_9BACT|nr:DUF3592 domain-containing protein [Hymenobacter terrestris]
MAVIVIILVVGTYIKAKKHHDRMQEHGVYAHGVVVRNKVIWGRIITVRPIVRFATQHGQMIEKLSTAGSAFAVPRYPQGTKVVLLYDPEDPHEFMIESADSSYI